MKFLIYMKRTQECCLSSNPSDRRHAVAISTLQNIQTTFTLKDLQENFPVAGNIDVFFVDVVVKKHCPGVFPGLLPEAKSDHINMVH